MKTNKIQLSKNGPEYTKLILVTKDNAAKYNGLPHLDIGVSTLQKLFDYEDVLQKNNIEQSPEGLAKFIDNHSDVVLATRLLAVCESLENSETNISYDLMKEMILSCIKTN